MKKHTKAAAVAALLLLLTVLTVALIINFVGNTGKPISYTGFAMSTLVTQTAYGKNAAQAQAEVQRALQSFENRLSMFITESDIARLNAAAGKAPVSVSGETMRLLKQGAALSQNSEGAFQLTIAPVTQLWGITTAHPRVPAPEELAQALSLVDDNDLILNEQKGTAYLRREGQAVDLGGIAKGAACELARDIYEKYHINGAVLSIGGNIYAKGKKPDGTHFRIGFRDPAGGENSYLATFLMKDNVLAVSGGYERYFEQDGIRYHHIIDPSTGYPAESDMVSVGVFSPQGALADMMSTTLFVWGSARTQDYMRRPGSCDVVFLDDNGTLYLSESLRETFELEQTYQEVPVIFIARKEDAA